jgi:hypothetical protein
VSSIASPSDCGWLTCWHRRFPSYSGAWTREQFYLWTSEYLRWLWYHEEDASLPKQALFALKPLLEYDAEVGVRFFIL